MVLSGDVVSFLVCHAHVLGCVLVAVVVMVLSGDVVSFLVYAGAHLVREQERMTGNVVYDYFMGVWLNPRFGSLDLKMLLETRVAWIMLFYITVGAACKQYDTTGAVHPAMWFMLTAHFLYANACMKVCMYVHMSLSSTCGCLFVVIGCGRCRRRGYTLSAWFFCSPGSLPCAIHSACDVVRCRERSACARRGTSSTRSWAGC